MRWTIALLLTLAACDQPAPKKSSASADIPAADLLLEHHDKDIDFSWSAAPQAVTQPKLLLQLRADADSELRKARRVAASDRAARPKDAPFFKHQYSQTWSRSAETPRLLVLGSTLDTFLGGAHGMYSFGAAIWDKEMQRTIPVTALFDDWSKARALLTKDYCKALDEERKRRRPTPFKGLMFNDCPPIDDQVLLPVGDNDGRVIALKVQIGPYEAGPYAEGSYQLSLDLPPELIALIKPDYRATFGYKQP